MVSQDQLVLLLTWGVMKDNNRQDFGGKKIIGKKVQELLNFVIL
jgi:hypothetical protein